MIEATQAAEIEARLAEIIGTSPHVVRDYLDGSVRAGGGRRTGYRFVRGTHGGSYVRDPDGADILPSGYEAPR